MNGDFEAWVSTFATPGEPHAILPGRKVRLDRLTHPLVMSADQAVQLARRLLDCATTPGEPIMLFSPERPPTQNERHLMNLLSWREREAAGRRAEIARLYYMLQHPGE